MTANVQKFFGAEGIKRAYEMTLVAREMSIKCLSRNYKMIVGDYFDSDYWPRVLKSSTKTREILLNTEENRKYASDLEKGKNVVAFVEENMLSESDFIVFDDIVLLISYNESSPFAVCIKDSETAKSMHNQFELMWKSADK